MSPIISSVIDNLAAANVVRSLSGRGNGHYTHRRSDIGWCEKSVENLRVCDMKNLLQLKIRQLSLKGSWRIIWITTYVMYTELSPLYDKVSWWLCNRLHSRQIILCLQWMSPVIQWHTTGHQLQQTLPAVLNASPEMTQIAQRGQHQPISILFSWKEKKPPNVGKKSQECVL